ncbi:MAG: hypothetical protein H7Z73_09935 [Candidatus Saccharibacteria bacterium]|nr:hypothetical protein [Moraxellaceae bacterium]
MNENSFLNFILNKVAIETTGIAIISAFDLEEFKIDDVTLFEKSKLLIKTNQATRLRCFECPDTCFAPVSIYPKNQFSPETLFITCKNGMGRTQVNSQDLNQWQVSARQIAQMVAKLQGHSNTPCQKNGLWHIGLVEGKHTSMLLLDFHDDGGVQCVINEQRVPLVEVMTFDGIDFKLDVERLKKMTVVSVESNKKISHKQEIRKQATNARNDILYKRYEELKKTKKDKTDNQIYALIKNEDIGQKLELATIKRIIAEKKQC